MDAQENRYSALPPAGNYQDTRLSADLFSASARDSRNVPRSSAAGRPAWSPTRTAATRGANRTRATLPLLSTFVHVNRRSPDLPVMHGPSDMTTAPSARGFFIGDYAGLAPAGSSFASLSIRANDANTSNRTDAVFSSVSP